MAFARLFLKIFSVLLAVFLVVGLLLPSSATVERARTIAAPPESVFPHLNDLQAFRTWSPWSDIDPQTQWTFNGPRQGVGAEMNWRSNHPEVGNGSMRILRSEPPQRVEMQLSFDGQGGGSARFHLEPDAGGTRVRWQFHSEFGWNLPGRYFGLMLDTVLGPFFEKGLDALAQQVEKPE